ncbi:MULTISPECIES: class C sortase [Lactococcus]|jgi:sortase A|uniref:Class C sortase n=1 Tax=Lactococcus formosensis TaxID=1281486 RepID=A0A9Q9D7Q6_9LACT|nr:MULTISPECIES: class C sortase [Lactococcus]USI66543.1 class C sortase [Lactococcus petauri]USJ21176.1 class C sortase [Lactococcus formosensis]WJE13654.1 class C sortase [Lactococcus petauri]
MRTQKKKNIKPRNNKGRILFKGIMLVLFLSGLITFSYPFLADAVNDIHDQLTIEKYQKDYSELNKHQKEERLKKIQEDNKKLIENNKLTNIPGMGLVKDPFDEASKDTQESGQKYLKAHMIGAIFIPKIKISQPVFDTTNTMLLEKGVTLLQGTSFPIGGKGTHAVLTGHSGLPDKKIFTDLEKLRKGDMFYINVSGKKLAYRIKSFKKVLPDNIDDLTIEDDVDQVTLVTCTPYMVNTHRLLVTGVRVPYNEVKAEQGIKSTKDYHFYRVIILCILVALILLVLIYKAIRFIKSKSKMTKR